MKKGLVTPFGEIQICIDGVPSDYEVMPHSCPVRSVREKPPAGCYKIKVLAKKFQTIRCIIAFEDKELSNREESGERYLCSEFVKNDIIVTVGAEDDNPAFYTNRLPNGMEYVLKSAIDEVIFGVAWATDYEGPFDIRTYLAADLF